MKEKNNLELFKNEIMYEFKHHPGRDLWDVMSDIYHRETGDKLCMYPEMLDWFADVPRETLELSKEIYDFLQVYYDEYMCEEYSIDHYIAPAILIDIGIIPKKYATYQVGDFMKIIKVKGGSNK